ncbi:MAG: bifunctional hydroxymethylpyrimidine kinase/phosphomethylpyrimidine kinase [Deltaproteobacteria bacterium]|nr:bifunctional hydroxymethylpyrimidine kinase/phosphomethylpyrimidine kinase [Deltaproteobacteria bacterium]
MAQARMPVLDAGRLEKLLKDFSRVRLLVVGDLVLDEYLWGDARRVSPEAPVPVVHVQGESIVLGGAGNVLRNVVALEAGCEISSVVGRDPDGDRVIALLEELGVDPGGVIRVDDRPTTHKTRVVARGQQIVRVDRGTDEPVSGGVAEQLLDGLQQRVAAVDGVILEDYGKGLLVPAAIRKIIACCAKAGVPVSVDPKSELRSFEGVALLKPNLREAEELTGIRVDGTSGLDRMAEKLREVVGDPDLVITRGGSGMSVFEGDRPRCDVATSNREVFDVQGAGDTAIAVLALARAAGASLAEAAVLANAGAGVVVEKAGTATASRDELAARLPEALAVARRGLG